ncbi:hypothetical protein KJ865_00515, partial [Myxococcota bacterium]|nr:hypothetical protein [Myxococcota bacterium]
MGIQQHTKRQLTGLIILLGIFFLGLLHTLHTSFFVCDDAFISFRYAQNLAEHGQLTYNPGEAVEGFSNFSWTLLLSLMALLQINLSISALILSAVASLITLGTTYLITRDLLRNGTLTPYPVSGTRFTDFIAFSAPIFLILWAPYTTWTAGGLETMCFTALFALSLRATLNKTPVAAGLLWGLTAITRPEGALFVLIAMGWLGADILRSCWKNKTIKTLLPFTDGVAFLVLLTGSLFLFRWYYYGELLPNTYYAKVWGIPSSFLRLHGLSYIHGFIKTYSLVYFVPILTGLAIILPRLKWELSLLLTLTITWFVYILSTGGDFMAMLRFFVPVLPLLALLLACSAGGFFLMVARRTKNLRIPGLVALLLCLSSGGLLLYRSLVFERASIRYEKRQLGMESVRGMVHYVSDRIKVGRELRRIFPSSITHMSMAVGGAGAISYESRIGRAIDTFGLMDKTIARKKVRPGKFYKPGHLKQASWASLRAQKP